MESQTKRTLIATLLCLGVLILWMRLFVPPAPQPHPADVSPSTQLAETHPSTDATAGGVTAAPAQGAEMKAADTAFHAGAGVAGATLQLGDDRAGGEFPFAAVISSDAASVDAVTLRDHRDHVARDPKNPDHDPYPLLKPVADPTTDQSLRSMATLSVTLIEEKAVVDLSGPVWSAPTRTVNADGESAVLEARVFRGKTPWLRIRKTYQVQKESYHLRWWYELENQTDHPLSCTLTERGPIGMRCEDSRQSGVFRLVVAAAVDDQGLVDQAGRADGNEVAKAQDRAVRLDAGERHLVWAAVNNMYFTCIVEPVPPNGQRFPDFLAKLSARAPAGGLEHNPDLTTEQVYRVDALPPGTRRLIEVGAFFGPKSDRVFDQLPEEYRKNDYSLVRSADIRWCTFVFLAKALTALLNGVHRLVGNYGISIIVLVIIVKLILHPISRRAQLNMMKSQKAMAQLKPKLELIQEQFKNDKQRLQQEMQKLYREEGVNPAGTILGCLPMFFQMPIWVALWTTLSTSVDMRHEPFFGWIRDLSAQDALVPFDSSYNIPLLGLLMGPIQSFNILPIIMAVMMYLQQKLSQRWSKPDKPPAPKLDEHGREVPDQLAQQMKMMNFMMIFMGLFFYNLPSGLNLYILSSSLFSLGETYLIKKHLREKEARGEFDLKKRTGARRESWLFKALDAAQKRADQARMEQSGRQRPTPRKRQRN